VGCRPGCWTPHARPLRLHVAVQLCRGAQRWARSARRAPRLAAHARPPGALGGRGRRLGRLGRGGRGQAVRGRELGRRQGWGRRGRGRRRHLHRRWRGRRGRRGLGRRGRRRRRGEVRQRRGEVRQRRVGLLKILELRLPHPRQGSLKLRPVALAPVVARDGLPQALCSQRYPCTLAVQGRRKSRIWKRTATAGSGCTDVCDV